MTRTTWKYIFVLVSIWLLILGYMGWQLLSVVEDSNRNVAAVMQKERHVELLQNQNEGLKKKLAELQADKNKLEIEVGQLRKKNLDLERKLVEQKSSNEEASKNPKPTKGKRDSEVATNPMINSYAFTPPSEEFLTTRRRAEKELKEIWYFVSSEVSKVNKIVSDKDVKSKLREMVQTVADMHHALSLNFEKLKTMDGQKEWVEKEHKELTDLVQRRLHYLQHPKDCNSAKKLMCQINKGCGYGCQVHHLMYCFIVAYGLQRTLIIDSVGWRYSAKGWNGIFKPVSESCTTYQGHVASWSGAASTREKKYSYAYCR